MATRSKVSDRDDHASFTTGIGDSDRPLGACACFARLSQDPMDWSSPVQPSVPLQDRSRASGPGSPHVQDGCHVRVCLSSCSPSGLRPRTFEIMNLVHSWPLRPRSREDGGLQRLHRCAGLRACWAVLPVRGFVLLDNYPARLPSERPIRAADYSLSSNHRAARSPSDVVGNAPRLRVRLSGQQRIRDRAHRIALRQARRPRRGEERRHLWLHNAPPRSASPSRVAGVMVPRRVDGFAGALGA